MKALLQRTTSAAVSIAGKKVGEIQTGIVIFLGVEKSDSVAVAEQCVNKIMNYRLFSDEAGKMNLSANDIAADLLIVSQFTLAAETKKGLRPGFSTAAPPKEAELIYNHFVEHAKNLMKGSTAKVATGQFGADMQVSLINDGPVTFLLEF